MKIKVVISINPAEVSDPVSVVGVAASMVQQAFANIPGISLVGISEITTEEEGVPV